MVRYLIPLALFIILIGFLAVGLKLDPREIPSPLIGKPAPAFQLPRLNQPQQLISNSDLKGKVWVLNVWASWCVSCRSEHPVLNQWIKQDKVTLVGLNYKDQSADARRWLSQLGNPYTMSLVDTDGRVGIDWGVYGVPETFIIDRQGTVRYKKTGPVSMQDVQQTLMPLIRQLRTES